MKLRNQQSTYLCNTRHKRVNVFTFHATSPPAKSKRMLVLGPHSTAIYPKGTMDWKCNKYCQNDWQLSYSSGSQWCAKLFFWGGGGIYSL